MKPFLIDVQMGQLNLQSDVLDLIDEVSPCKMPGIMVKTAISAGSGIRPMELSSIFRGLGLEVERPIKVETELRT